MSDTLTTDAIAALLIDARTRSYKPTPDGEKRVTMTLERVEMLCHEVLRLRAACALAWEHLDRYGYRGHEDQIKSQDAVFEATRPCVDFTGRL